MLKEFIDRIIELSKTDSLRLGLRDYTTNPIYEVKTPLDEKVCFRSLDSLLDFVGLHSETFDDEDLCLIVNDQTTVSYGKVLCNAWGARQCYAKCCSFYSDKKYVDFSFMGMEEFLVACRARFSTNEQLKQMLSLCSNVTATATLQEVDSGISQNVTVNKSVIHKEVKKINPIWSLAPYRTFDEVKQPESEYILRVHLPEKDGGNISFSLIEMESDLWKVDAMKAVKDYLVKGLAFRDIKIKVF